MKLDFSTISAIMLTAIEDSIDERIYNIEGDVVHTDWEDEDWENYKAESCNIENAEAFLKFAEELSNTPTGKLREDTVVEFAEISSIFFPYFQRLIKERTA